MSKNINGNNTTKIVPLLLLSRTINEITSSNLYCNLRVPVKNILIKRSFDVVTNLKNANKKGNGSKKFFKQLKYSKNGHRGTE